MSLVHLGISLNLEAINTNTDLKGEQCLQKLENKFQNLC